MKYLFVFILTIINIFFLIWFIGGLIILPKLTGSSSLVLFVCLILIAIGGLLLFNLGRGLLHFIKVNNFKCARAVPIIDIKVRENLTLNLICVEIGVLLFANCGFTLNRHYEVGILNWLFIGFAASLIPGMIIWLYSIKNNPQNRVKDYE
jgi:hypothetical protein